MQSHPLFRMYVCSVVLSNLIIATQVDKTPDPCQVCHSVSSVLALSYEHPSVFGQTLQGRTSRGTPCVYTHTTRSLRPSSISSQVHVLKKWGESV